MDSKIKILVGILVVGILLISGWWVWKSKQLDQVEKWKEAEVEENLSKMDAYNLVVLQVLNGITKGKDIYVSEVYLTPGMGEINLPKGEGWYFFIDDQPGMDWAHPCRYVYVDNSGNITVENSNVPPRNFEDMELVNTNGGNLTLQIEQNEAISKALEYWSKEEGYSGMGVPEVRLHAGNVTEYRNYWLVEICSLNMNTKEMKTLGFVIVSKVENIVKKETERYKECVSESNFTPTPPSVPKHMDKNNNRISDELEDKIKAENRRVEVIITLREPCTREDLDNFESLGGNIRHIYNSVFYGFSGDIPGKRIFMLAESLNTLYFIELDHEIELH